MLRRLAALPGPDLIPVAVQAFEAGFRQRHGVFAGAGFDVAEAAVELDVGVAQRGFALDTELASEVGGGEQQVTQFLVDLGGVAGFRRGSDFVEFLANLGLRLSPIRPVELH